MLITIDFRSMDINCLIFSKRDKHDCGNILLVNVYITTFQCLVSSAKGLMIVYEINITPTLNQTNNVSKSKSKRETKKHLLKQPCHFSLISQGLDSSLTRLVPARSASQVQCCLS